MSIFIDNSSGKSKIISDGSFTKIEPDNLEIVFDGEKIRFAVSLLSNGNLKVMKFNKDNKEEVDKQQKKLISSLANEIIIC